MHDVVVSLVWNKLIVAVTERAVKLTEQSVHPGGEKTVQCHRGVIQQHGRFVVRVAVDCVCGAAGVGREASGI